MYSVLLVIFGLLTKPSLQVADMPDSEDNLPQQEICYIVMSLYIL